MTQTDSTGTQGTLPGLQSCRDCMYTYLGEDKCILTQQCTKQFNTCPSYTHWDVSRDIYLSHMRATYTNIIRDAVKKYISAGGDIQALTDEIYVQL